MAATWSALSCSQAASASGLFVSQLMPEPVPHMPVPPQEPEPPHMPPPHQESPACRSGASWARVDGVGLPIMPPGALAPAIGTRRAVASTTTARAVSIALNLPVMR